MVKAVVYNSIRRLANSEDVEFSILMNNSGKVMVEDGELGDDIEEFITYAATLYASVIQSNKSINKKFPRKITIEDPDGYTILQIIDKNHFIVVRTKSTDNLKAILDKMDNARWSIMQEL